MTKEQLQELGFEEKEIQSILESNNLTIDKIQQLLDRGWTPYRITTSAVLGILPDSMIESKGKKTCKTKKEFADALSIKFKEYIGKIGDKFSQLLDKYSAKKIDQYNQELEDLKNEKQQFVEQAGNEVYDNQYTTSTLNQLLQVETHLKNQQEIYDEAVKNSDKSLLDSTKQALDKSKGQFKKVVDNHPTYKVYKEFEEKIAILENLRIKQQRKFESNKIIDKIKPNSGISSTLDNAKISIQNMQVNFSVIKDKAVDKFKLIPEYSKKINMAEGLKNISSKVLTTITEAMQERAEAESFDDYQKPTVDEEIVFTPEMIEPQSNLVSDGLKLLNVEDSYAKLKYIYENNRTLATHIQMMLDECVTQIDKEEHKSK